MDITLKRILSLIPKNELGKYVHGAKKDFAVSIGYEDGNIISHWENGRSNSYTNKLFEISAVYGVSVEWLKGETDIKEIAAPERSDTVEKIVKLARELSPEQIERLLAYGQGMKDSEK